MTIESFEPIDASWANRTLSEGTLRPSDLGPLYLWYLMHLKQEAWVSVAGRTPESWDSPEGEAFFYEELVPLMESLAPEGTYFGGHPDDPAAIGYWALDPEDACATEGPEAPGPEAPEAQGPEAQAPSLCSIIEHKDIRVLAIALALTIGGTLLGFSLWGATFLKVAAIIGLYVLGTFGTMYIITKA